MNNEEKKKMNCERVQELFIDYFDDALGKDIKEKISAHLYMCENCCREYEKTENLMMEMDKVEDILPALSLRPDFERMLKENKAILRKAGRNEGKLSWLLSGIPFLKYAAVVVIFVSGIFTGTLIKKEEIRTIEIPVAKNEIMNSHVNLEKEISYQPATEELNKAQISTEISSLKEEVNSLKSRMVFYMARQSSPIEKIQAVNYVEKMSRPDEKLIETLFNLLNFDKNMNVRSAAFNAIGKFKKNSLVKTYLIESLQIQSEPSLQISIINLLVNMKDKSAIEPLNKLSEDAQTNKNVKYEADVALRKLRSL